MIFAILRTSFLTDSRNASLRETSTEREDMVDGRVEMYSRSSATRERKREREKERKKERKRERKGEKNKTKRKLINTEKAFRSCPPFFSPSLSLFLSLLHTVQRIARALS